MHSSFSFLDGVSAPEKLVERAHQLGLEGLALTDHNGLYGVVRFAEAAAAHTIPTVFGAELSVGTTLSRTETPDPAGTHLLVLARGEEGYHRLSSALTDAHLATEDKGTLRVDMEMLTQSAGGHWMILTGCRKGAVRSFLPSHRMPTRVEQ